MRPDTRTKLRRMIGEIFREVGVLVLVLFPLESVVAHDRLTLRDLSVTLIVAVPALVVGIWLGTEHDS